MKLTYEQKLQMCLDHKNGLSYKSVARKYSINRRNFEYIWLLYEKHGTDILKHKFTHWTTFQKDFAVNRVLNGESIKSVSIDIGLPTSSTLARWLKEYKENGYTIVERKRGRPPMNKSSTNKKENLTLEERIKQLERENLELKAENEYLKKLDALVQKRKAQQLKNKS